MLQLSRLELCAARTAAAPHLTAGTGTHTTAVLSLACSAARLPQSRDCAAGWVPEPPACCAGAGHGMAAGRAGAGGAAGLLTVNVNGLGSPSKARALVSHLQQVGADVAMVQETHATDTTALESCLRAAQGACLPWRHCLAASPAASPHSCGAAILARSRLSLPGCVLQPPSTDAAGRVVCWDWDVGHLRLRFVCVYAPTAVADKPAFFAGLHPHLATDRVLVVGGDWNCVTDASQEAAPSPSRAAGAPQLASLLAQFSLVDPWASKRGGAKGYTHPATPKPATPARLDRWYVSATAAPWVVDVARTYGAPGDHNGVLLTLALPDLPHAHREQWRFPTYLLFHPSLRLELEQRLEAHVAANPVASTGDGACTQWEADKFFLREAATSIHRRHARQTRDGLHGVVLAADAAAALADRPGASTAQRQAAAMANLAVREERAAAAAASHNARAALMEEHGERGTRWFHRQADEPAAGAQEPITHLKVPGQPAPVALTGPGTRNTVSAAAAAMYSSTSPTGLFRVQPVCTASQQQLLAAIDRKVPADLHAAAEGSGDGALSDAELMAALAGSANGKAPGSDGVPYEVYKVFWALLGPRLCAAAAAAFAAAADAHDGGEMAAALPASWREGIITLIYKGKSLDRAELASYRPITLLNCDFKMVSKAVSARLQPALDAVVDELQTAFITGRWIGDNALYLQGLIEWMRLDVGADGTPRQGGALYFLDIEKAYDWVHRQWLYASAEGLGFGPRMLRWIRLITANGSARVCVNGMLSDAFPVLNGLPQGSTASPPLWVIQMQPLTSFLRRQVEQGALRTPLLPSGEQAPPAAHHADDTTLTARDPAVDGPVLMAAVQLFCRASNARVHPDKSKAMGLGRFAHLTGPCPHTGVPFTTGAVTHLGVPLSWDSDAAAADLYTRRARGMAFVARLWAALSLTLVGRVHIAKQVLAAKLAYHFSFLNPSPAQLKELTDLVDHFAARSMHAEDASLVSHGNPLLLPKRETACLPYKDGGVNHVDLPAFLSALQAKTFALLAQPGRQPWKMLTRALLTHVRPDSATTWAWVYSDAPAPAGLPARLAAAVGHVRSAGVEQHPPQPATQPPAAPPQWRVSLDQLWVANAAGAVSYVHYTGRLLEPGPGVLPPAVDGAWQPACVLQHRKPRHLWTFEERAAYDAASPGDRAGAWPRAPYFLAPEAGVVVHPEHCRIAGVSLADYTVRDVRRAITAANLAAPPAPARPAAMPCPAPAQQAGGSGTQPAAQSRLAEREAEWQRAAAQLTTTAAQHFNNNPVALDPWLHRTSAAAGLQNTPARTLQSYASPFQHSGEGPRRSARLQEQAAGGAGPSTGPATAAAAAAAAVEGDPRMPPPDASLLRDGNKVLQLSRLELCAARNAVAPHPTAGTGTHTTAVLAPACSAARLPRRAGKGIRPRVTTGCGGLGAHCPHPACGPPGPRAWASLTHIFLECPAYAQARTWLQQLWACVAPQAAAPPVTDAGFMLGDRMGMWTSGPRGAGALLWSTLRATFLYAVWCAYWSREPAKQTSEHVVREVVSELRRVMQLRFTAATLTPETLSALPTQLLTAQLKAAKLEHFVAIWSAGGALCEVEEVQGGSPKLHLRLTLASPVQAP
ncbi:hypothetical protein CHLRE_05g235102v5 [Chlamydomonas reinhardtii]|uniref:Reverse transcriptase domain-containing protein n=1 Tax=Chlamydomonas reinhardtii TaxID=3055 RepID=A0A2K3DSQ4_CHLRE|nr:uncharacterized protein CHLRE_05g235102v5 [Chlamydomonas reinhardtii]PNW83569.1 hypothetical protein CHLRE_05g235102v5 [Chlamydomonas reinhardtii]